MAFNWIVPNTHHRRMLAQGRTIFVVRSKDSKVPRCYIYISEELMKEARWVYGDSVQFGMDEAAGTACIRRAITGQRGWTLAKAGKGLDEVKGQCGKSVFSLTGEMSKSMDAFPDGEYPGSVMPEGIVFLIPKPTVPALGLAHRRTA